MRIPKIIHQTWKTKDIPYNVYKKEWVDSWKRFHPDWEYRLWTDEDNRKLIERHYPDFLSVYDGYPLGINRADAARYFILYHYGGLYVDLDFECLKNFEPILRGYDLVFGRMRSGLFIRHCIPNALMASTKNNVFWQFVMKELPRRKSVDCVELATGPAMLWKVLLEYQVKRWLIRNLLKQTDNQFVRIYSPEYFYPISWKEKSVYHNAGEDMLVNKSDYPEAYALTYWCHYW